MKNLLLLAATSLILTGCGSYVPPNYFGCYDVNLDGPTTDSSASGHGVIVPDNYEVAQGEAKELIQLCDEQDQ